jgi:hypothetical protein
MLVEKLGNFAERDGGLGQAIVEHVLRMRLALIDQQQGTYLSIGHLKQNIFLCLKRPKLRCVPSGSSSLEAFSKRFAICYPEYLVPAVEDTTVRRHLRRGCEVLTLAPGSKFSIAPKS